MRHCAALEDHRKLIAAGKSQRWDVIKWAVTLNVALTTALIALLKDHPGVGKWFFLLALFVVGIAALLMLHYNNRMKNVRNDELATHNCFVSNGIDLPAIVGKPATKAKWRYDWQELAILPAILFSSILPVLIVWLAG